MISGSILNSKQHWEGGIAVPVLQIRVLRQRKEFACGLTVSKGWTGTQGF